MDSVKLFKFHIKFHRALLLTAFFGAYVFSGAVFAGARGEYVEGEALVLLKNNDAVPLDKASARSGVARSYAQSAASRADAEAVTTYAALSAATNKVFLFVRSKSDTTEELIAKLKSDPNVVAAVPNYISYARAVPNDPFFNQLWGMDKIGAPRAWDTTTGGPDVYVAVADSGVTPTHEDLVGNFDEGRSKNFTTNSSYVDGNGHGTHVIGTVGAVGNNGLGVAGVNWATKIIALKILNDEGLGSDAEIIGGLDYVKDLLEKNPDMRMAAINFSLGGWRSMTPDEVKDGPYYQAYKALSDTNRTVIVVAAGNEGHEAGQPNPERFWEGMRYVEAGEYTYPASLAALGTIENMIVVGASSMGDKAPGFTNWSERFVDVLAPGVDIESTVKNGKYERDWNGTSMAAPHAAGAIALLSAANPAWTARDLKRILLETANHDVNPTTGPTYKFDSATKVSAHGLIDVGKAVETVLNLSALGLSAGTLVPAFDPWTTGYVVQVDNSVNALTVTPKAEYPLIATTIAVKRRDSGERAGSALSLYEGANVIDVVVKHANGVAAKTYTLTVKKEAREAEPEVYGLTADPATVRSGGTSAIAMTGVKLSDKTQAAVFYEGTRVDEKAAETAGDGFVRTGELTFPVNDDTADKVYTVRASLNGTDWTTREVAVTVLGTKNSPAITGMGIGADTLSWRGGDSSVAVKGVNLPNYVRIGAFVSGASEPSVTEMTFGTSTEQATRLTIPVNDSTSGAKSYIVKASFDGTNWLDAHTGTITASAKPVLRIDGITVDPVLLPKQGGDVDVTVTGANLSGPLAIIAFDSEGYAVTSQAFQHVDPDSVNTTLWFMDNEGTSDEVYTIKVALGDSQPLDSPSATVTILGKDSASMPALPPQPSKEDEKINGSDVVKIGFDGDEIVVTYADGGEKVFDKDDYNVSVVYDEARFAIVDSDSDTALFRADGELIHDGAAIVVTAAASDNALSLGKSSLDDQGKVTTTAKTKDGKTEVAIPASSLLGGRRDITFDSGEGSNPRYKGILAMNYTHGFTTPASKPSGGGCDVGLGASLLFLAAALAAGKKK
ncbi:MAG: S8 family serine peptidase [Synergistaceae bacterium]|jgi:subtilisin family serine protease|nr:S8 family serine peptidase [Synergistaceae bacterium]